MTKESTAMTKESTSSEELRQAYLSAIQLHLWYKGSKFSFHQGKASKEAAMWWRTEAHRLHDAYAQSLRGK